MGDLPRPFSDIEYSLLVLNALKRSVRVSESLMHWVPPRDFTEPQPDRREIMQAIDLAIASLRDRMQGGKDR